MIRRIAFACLCFAACSSSPATEPAECTGDGPCTGGHLWSVASTGVGGGVGVAVAGRVNGNVLVTGNMIGGDFGGGSLAGWFLAELDAAGAHVASKTFGEGGGAAVAIAGADRVIVAGTASGRRDFGDGMIGQDTAAADRNLFVLGLDAALNATWAEAVALVGEYDVPRLAIDSAGQVIVAGCGQNAGRLVALSMSGGENWRRDLAGVCFTGVAVAADRTIAIAGTTSDNGVDFGGGPLAINASFVARLDADGNHLSTTTFSTDAHVLRQTVAVDAAGNIFVAGDWMRGTIDFGGDALSPSGLSTFLAKLDAQGAHVWSRSFEGAIGQGQALATDAKGDVVLGVTRGDQIGVRKIRADGGDAWSRQFSGDASLTQAIWSLATDAGGDAIATGYFEGKVDFGGGSREGGPKNRGQVFVVELAP